MTYWTPTDCLPDRMVLVLEAGTVSLDEACEVLRARNWPAPSPVSVPGDDGSPRRLPGGGWAATVGAAHLDHRVSSKAYRALPLTPGLASTARYDAANAATAVRSASASSDPANRSAPSSGARWCSVTRKWTSSPG